jgi:hypothetical protein
MIDLKKVFLTKDDKVDLLKRMDNNFKWLVGIILALFGVFVAIIKL